MKLKGNFYSYLGMTKRHIFLFFKDKSTLFFSMLSPLIVFFLYVVLLKNTYLSGIKESIEGLEEYVSINDVTSILDSWLLAGILSTSSITVALHSLHIMVSDKSLKIDYDYGSSPVKGHLVILSYFTDAFLNTLIINASILTVGLIVLNIIGNLYLSFSTILLLYLVTILASASATIIMMVIVSFFKKTSALAAFSGIVSAAVGFVVGAYIPLGSFNDT
jgi:multidrug/hemolysin transport system permease protein